MPVSAGKRLDQRGHRLHGVARDGVVADAQAIAALLEPFPQLSHRPVQEVGRPDRSDRGPFTALLIEPARPALEPTMPASAQ